MKLSQWSKLQGITYLTAYKWFHQGIIPNSRQLPTGTILVDEEKSKPLDIKVVVYARVSNQSRKKELEYQIERCTQFANAKGLPIEKTYKEIASGMNDNRREMWKMLESNPTTIIVENKDRLTRFGFNYLEKLLKKQNCEIIVMNKDHEDEKDLMKDFISIMTSFCCRLYGLRKGQNKAAKLKNIIQEQNV